ncbi:hypothetical protein D1B31_18215 [Neobacillus notoginsengisoli]|uniref:DNRLRE domain-containing protein n=1 Tax=Neobacillus notoginsengisoli TaxID=1578198 RepID=A0A417YQA8_9BACI|nr:DNRLRE domain-containing protein [Neobacillus notoginsengisoli]RHW36022.1 hypothetical protein D1B31_18215 [Neobacillus notoginsengisoli]
MTFDYSVEGSKVKENIILDSYRGKNVFKFHLKAAGMKAFKTEMGSIEFRDEKTGEFLFLIQRPYMYDSTEAAEISLAVSQEIEPVNDGFLLTVSADEAYLTSKERVYPVVIDPWIDVFQAQDTLVSSTNSNTNYSILDYLSVGTDGAMGKTRTYAKWELPNIPNARIAQASLGVYQYSSSEDTPVSLYRVTSPWDVFAVKWSTQPSFHSPASATITMGTGKGYKYFPVSDLVKGWYDNTFPNYGVVLKYANTQETNGVKKFRSAEWSSTDSSPYGKPKLVITYRPRILLGITDYWQYTPDLFNGEGSAVVNVMNGNMVYDIPVLNLPGRTDAFNLKLVYNSRSGYDDAFGYRWILNASRKLIPNVDKSIIEYIDDNGTRFHFNKQQHDTGTAYSAPEGTYFELNSTANGGYTIKHPDETVYHFDSLGRNTKIVDEKGNTVLYTFDGTSGRITKISERYGTETTGRDLNLSYNSGTMLLEKITDFKGTETRLNYEYSNPVHRLTSITYAANRTEQKKISFAYDTGHQIISVTDGRGNKGQIAYDSEVRVTKITDPRSENIYSELQYPGPYETVFKDANGHKTYYRNDGNLELGTANVVEIIEDYEGGNPSTTKYEWKNNEIVKVIEPSKDGSATGPTTTTNYDAKGNVDHQTYPDQSTVDHEFDDKSNLMDTAINGTKITENHFDGKSNLIFSTDQAGNTDFFTYDKYGNTLSSTTSTSPAVNLVPNRSFEAYDANALPLNWGMRAGGGYTAATIYKYGSRSGKITVTGTESYRYYFQNIAIPVIQSEEPFTVSGFIKTENLTGIGAQIVVYFKDSADQFIKDASGNAISYATHALKGTKDWSAVTNTFTAPKNTAYVQVLLSFNGAGSAYYDGIQLYRSADAGEYVSNENEGMETGSGTTLDKWTLNALGTGDGKSTVDKLAGTASARLTGSATTSRYIGQLVQANGKGGNPITISGWAKAIAPNQTGDFSLQATFVYSDGTEGKFTVPFDRNMPGEWQFAKKTFRAAKDFSQVKLYANFNNQSGTVFFDNIKLEERASSSSTGYTPDGNFVKTETNALNQTASFDNDANGNQTAIGSPKGNRTSFGYDFLNRLTSVTQVAPAGKSDITTRYLYDRQGNLEKRTDARGNVTSFTYNAINQLERETDPLGKFIRYEYHNNGNLKAVEKGKSDSVHSRQEFFYNSKNQLEEMKMDGRPVNSYGYDGAGNMTSIVSNGQKYQFGYDDNNRMTSTAEPGGYEVGSTYENDTTKPAQGLRTAITETWSGKAMTTSFTYDTQQRLSSLTTSTGAGIQMNYSEKGLSVQERFMKTGVQLSTGLYQSFDELGRLDSQQLLGTSELNMKYAYDIDGNLSAYTEGNQIKSFTYDFANRLESWTSSGKTVSYQYDPAGNLLNPNGKSLTFNAANEIEGFDYDYTGNIKKDDKYQYEWDKEGRLVSVKDLAGGTIASYTYHPDGLRKTKMVGGVTYSYHYDGSDLIRITDKGNNTVWAFTWIDGKPKTVTNSQGQTFFYITNYRGDVVRVIDEAGLEVASYSYDPWGNVLQITEQAVVENQSIGYAGYYYDRETNLYYLQARYYDPGTARFLSRDPFKGRLDEPITQNAYVYANNNPLMNIDPDGLHSKQVWGNHWWNAKWFVANGINWGIIAIIGGGLGGLSLYLRSLAKKYTAARARIIFSNSLKRQLLAKGVSATIASYVAGATNVLFNVLMWAADPGGKLFDQLDSRDKRRNNGYLNY